MKQLLTYQEFIDLGFDPDTATRGAEGLGLLTVEELQALSARLERQILTWQAEGDRLRHEIANKKAIIREHRLED